MNIALVTCLHLEDRDDDAQLLRDSLLSRGLDAQWVAWDDPGVGWERFPMAILRSTWNYYLCIDDFRNWLGQSSKTTHICNPLAIVEWNVHKGYLGELGKLGIQIVPTEFIEVANHQEFSTILERRRWEQAVIKPAISAASYRTYRFARAQAAAAQPVLDELIAGRDVLVQQYLPSVETYGERSLIWIDGQVTHAIRKNPRFSTDSESVSEAIEPTKDELHFALRVIDCLKADLLYARVDLMRGPSGEILLSELELIEPSLFLMQHPPALERFADAISRRAEFIQARPRSPLSFGSQPGAL